MIPRWIQDAWHWYHFILMPSATIIVLSSCPSGTSWASTVYKPHANTTWLLSCAPVNTPAAEFGTPSSCLDYSLVNLSGRIFWNQWRPKGPTCCAVARRSYGNCTGNNVVIASQKTTGVLSHKSAIRDPGWGIGSPKGAHSNNFLYHYNEQRHVHHGH